VLFPGCQSNFRRRQTLLRFRKLTTQSRDLRLLGGQLADLLARPLALKHTSVTELSPLRYLRGIDALLPQIRATLVPQDRLFIRSKEVELLRRSERPPRYRTARARAGTAVLAHRTISSRTAIKDGLDMMDRFLVLALRRTADLLLAAGLTRP